jgi:oligopeptide transport system ATP-binding protein
MLNGPLLDVRDVVQEFAVRGPGGVKGAKVHAVSNVSFDMRAGETLGVVGETGSGKSTLARSVIQAPRPKSGEVRFLGTDLMKLGRRGLTEARRQMQMVYQDPFGSLNPRWKITELVEEPLLGYGVRAAPRAGPRAARPGRAGSGRVRPAPPARAVGRAVPAGRHRPRHRAEPGADRL